MPYSMHKFNLELKVQQGKYFELKKQRSSPKIFISCHQATGPTPDAANRRQNISLQNTYSSKSPLRSLKSLHSN